LEVQILLGDSADNIPGIPGVGKKTAADLVNAHGDVAGVVAACERGEVSRKKVAATIVESKERLDINRELVHLRQDLELEQGPKDLEKRAPDPAQVQALFRELEFYALLRELPDVLRTLGAEEVDEEQAVVAADGFELPP